MRCSSGLRFAAFFRSRMVSCIAARSSSLQTLLFFASAIVRLAVVFVAGMSVAERTREIGIRRAIGGSRRRIVRELVAEAGVIGLLGGLIGLGLGAAVVVLVNEAGRSSGTVLFDLTAQTAAFAVGFSTILGMVAGIIPAWTAARLDPVSALRYE